MRPVERIRSLIPLTLRIGLVRAATRIRARAGRWRVECPICGGRFRAFLPAGLVVRQGALCPDCGSLERHRLQWLYLKHPDRLSNGIRVLHIAPEPCLSDRIRLRPIVYVTADLNATHVAVRLDVTRLGFADDSFDLILCSHVLEHVPDDAAALSELYRVLAPGGWSMLQVPIEPALRETYEDPAITDPALREVHFRQSDHVRLYGGDYASRLEAAGFDVTVDTFAFKLPVPMVKRYGLVPEIIHVGRKRIDTPSTPSDVPV